MSQFKSFLGIGDIADAAAAVTSTLDGALFRVAFFVDIVGRFPDAFEGRSAAAQRDALIGDGPLVFGAGDLELFVLDA